MFRVSPDNNLLLPGSTHTISFGGTFHA